MLHHVFLSYSRRDMPFMRRVKQDLNKAGLIVWTDEGIEPGTSSWQRSIENAIVQTGCMLCILSPDAAQSEWVREELNFARLHNKDVILLMGRGDEKVSVPFGYSLSQWVDIRNVDAYKNNMKRVIIMLHQRFSSETLARTEQLKPLPPNFGLGVTSKLVEDPPDLKHILPQPFAWSVISSGRVSIDGSNIDVERFYMATYPITNAQFQVFVDDKLGYINPGWYNYSEQAMEWFKGRRSLMDNMYSGDDIPRVYVSWYEAMAFTQWLNKQVDSAYRFVLPTEEQWQWAAQGDDGRTYPWGNEYDKRRCNTLKSNVNEPTSVLTYPSGASPFGVMDMCGNVFEWCLTDWDGSSETERGGNRVIRGGAWDSNRSFAQVVIRNYAKPYLQTGTIGFRIAAVLPSD